MFAATRSRCGGLAFMVALLCAFAAAPAWASVPAGYSVQPVDDGPVPDANVALGSRVANAGHIDDDATDDVAVGLPDANGGHGQVLLVSGATGQGIYRIQAPTEPASSGAPAGFGSSVARLGDILNCVGGAGGDCRNKSMSGDGYTEFLVGAPGADVNSTTGVDQGRAYVIDGKTGAIASRVMLAVGDLPPGPAKAEFGFSVLPAADLDSDGKPDFAVGAPGFTESDSTHCPGVVCTQAGRVYVYAAADLGGQAVSPLQAPALTIENPFAADDPTSQRFGHSLAPLADIGQCNNQSGGGGTCLATSGNNVPSNVPDGKPEILVSAPLLDQGSTANVGAAFVLDGAFAVVIKRINAVEPQVDGRFGLFSYQPPAPPALGGPPGADIVIGAPHHSTGRAFVIDGDPTAASTLLASLSDPAPADGGRFGWAVSGLNSGGFAVGAAFGARAGTVRLFGTNLALAQTICDPDGQPGAQFGAAIATLGDANGDGFDELAVGAPDFDHPAGGTNAGRLYIFTSKGPAATGAPGACVPIGATGSGDGSSGGGDEQFTSPDEDSVVIARVLRRLVLKANHKRVRKFASFRLRGRLTASSNRSVCQRRQKIALQRRKASGGRFQTFEVALTRANGKFTARAIAERTFVYRARVSKTARCMGAVSKTAKVSILRKRGSR